jgi:hypothetical protein
MGSGVEGSVSSSLVRRLVLSVGRVGKGDLGVGEDVLSSSRSRGLDVEDEELYEVGDVGESGEGITPVDSRGKIDGVEGSRIDEVDGVGDASADGEGAEGGGRRSDDEAEV